MSKWTLAIGVCLAQQDHFLLLSSCSVFTPRHCSAALLDTGAGGWTWILWTGRGLYTNLLFSQDTVGYILLNLSYMRVGVGTLSDLATFRLILLVICHSPCSNRLKLYHITFTCTFKMNLWALPQSRQIEWICLSWIVASFHLCCVLVADSIVVLIVSKTRNANLV